MSSVPTVHELTCHPDYFGDVKDGTKTYELRRGDRHYKVDDYLWLREFSEDGAGWLDECMCRVTHVLGDRDSEGLADGWVLLGIRVLS